MEYPLTITINSFDVGNDLPWTLFAGINVLESKDLALQVGEQLQDICQRLNINYVFKASFDKANRSSLTSYRGPGLEEGLRILDEVKNKLGVPIITDVHEAGQAEAVAEVADVVQLPAFLCRQTDLVEAVAKTGKVINVKKMQMMAPEDMNNIIDKCSAAGNSKVMLCERGTSFGYHNLIVDMLGFETMKSTGKPVIFDVTHSLQKPGGLGLKTDGRGKQAESLALAAMSQKIAGLFLETHPNPAKALCDGPCATPLSEVESLINKVHRMDQMVKSF